MINKKILILDSSGTDWTDKKMVCETVDVEAIYAPRNLFYRILRRICFKIKFPFKAMWYGVWKNKLNQYHSIIIFSALLEKDIFSYIRKNGFENRLIFYYRDPMTATPYTPEDLKKLNAGIDIWSFDESDSVKYGIKYNPQFYFYNVIDKRKVIYDIVFVGYAKKRLEKILKMKKFFQEKGLKMNFHIMATKNIQYTKDEQLELIKTSLDYVDVLKLNASSRAILEINQEGQSGLTVRAMEALFMKKKLITNNASIRKMDFYHSHNVFILGMDNIEKIKEFLDIPYQQIDDEVIKKYSYGEWLKRFDLLVDDKRKYVRTI